MAEHPARQLFRVAPADYVTERTRLVREARAAGDRELANQLQALKKPTLAMWAVLAAPSDDPTLVRDLFEATATLGTVQLSGDRDDTVEASEHRRGMILVVVKSAVQALDAHEPSAASRVNEIRTIVDRLSRHPELASAWSDGTLRDLPDVDAFGFAAFTGFEPPTPRPSDRPARRERALRSVPDAPTDTRPPPDPERDRADRAARAARAAERRDAIRARDRAASTLATAERRLASAVEAFRQAESDLATAQAAHDQAAARHEAAVERVDALAEE
ncbi:MAG: hypothetical protein KDB40_08630 [Acidimicrobiales bacterium]|nr:hypothetical protein [Acidimicrobiales bacterium]MCB9393938.1 hypothetical protein [Acidimicrobiaceae bacterium]